MEKCGSWASGSIVTYNNDCPKIGGTKTLVGCGGVAVAQILNYYSCQINPKDILSYTPSGLSTININFANQIYFWNSMSPNNATSENAKLLFHSAAAIKSQFGVSKTTAEVADILVGLPKYFDFSSLISRVDKSYYNDDAWKDLLKNQIDGRNPILYLGQNTNGSQKHGWVVDGYSVDSNNKVSQFHCNWGWGGSSNGFFSLSNLTNVSGQNYNDTQSAIVSILPKYAPNTFRNYTFPCGNYTAYSFRLVNCKVAPNVPDAVRLNMQCATEIFGTFEVPLGSVFEIKPW